jgi:hypothetical protein
VSSDEDDDDDDDDDDDSVSSGETDDSKYSNSDVEDLENNEIIEITETEPIVVNKIDVDDISETQSLNENSNANDRESYKKMALPALRGFIISKGYQTDSAKLQKMKKNELIDLIIESQK